MRIIQIITLLLAAVIPSFAQYQYCNYSETGSTFITLTPCYCNTYFAITTDENIEKATANFYLNEDEHAVQKLGDGYFILDTKFKTLLQSDFESDIGTLAKVRV